MKFDYAKDITADLAAASSQLNFETLRQSANNDYNFFVGGIMINPSAEDTVEQKTVVCESGNNVRLTLILDTGCIHELRITKIIKSGTTTNRITIFGQNDVRGQ